MSNLSWTQLPVPKKEAAKQSVSKDSVGIKQVGTILSKYCTRPRQSGIAPAAALFRQRMGDLGERSPKTPTEISPVRYAETSERGVCFRTTHTNSAAQNVGWWTEALPTGTVWTALPGGVWRR